MLLSLPIIFIVVIVYDSLIWNLSGKSISHKSDSLVFLCDLLLYTLNFSVFLELFIVEFLL